MLEVKDLHKYYGTFPAVRGVTFDVAPGEIVGFLGPNGAGKTTTMKIITGFMAMTSGQVRVDGHDVTADSLEVRRRIGYLPESAPLYDDLTVTEYLSFIADVRGMRGALRRERMAKVIGVCGLDSKARAVIKTLSKGFRQRVGLAQAIIHDPKLVILDEPTVGLDPNQIADVRDLIRQIGQNNTVMLSSHVLSEVEATCTRVIIINDGMIVAVGTAAELQRQHSEGARVKVSIRGADEKALIVLRELESVASATLDNRVAPICDMTVQPKARDAFLVDLQRACVARGWVLESLRDEASTLEDVFRKLTSSGRAPMTSASFSISTTAVQAATGIEEGKHV